jgi:hypothetical protein
MFTRVVSQANLALRRLPQWIRPYRAVALSSVLILASSALQVMLPVVISARGRPRRVRRRT